MKKKKLKKWLKRWQRKQLELACQQAIDATEGATEAAAKLGGALSETTLGVAGKLLMMQEAERVGQLIASGELTAEAGISRLEGLSEVIPIMTRRELIDAISGKLVYQGR